jgi:argininosuccinate synthase
LENPDQEAPETLYQMTTAPETSSNDPTVLEITFDKGFLLLTHKKTYVLTVMNAWF